MPRILTDIATVMWRDWVVLKRRLKKFILSRLVTPVLYLVAFGWGLGRSITLDSGTYLDFLVPGIIALNSMNVSYMSATTVHAEKIYHKSLEEYLSAPISPLAYVAGKLSSAVLRALISTGLILLVAALFQANFALTAVFFVVVILNAVTFAGVGFCAALRVQTYEELAQVNTYLLMPMSFLCGTFFGTEQLPEAVRLLVGILPLTQTSALLRTGFDAAAMAILALYAAALIFLSCREFEKLVE